MQRLTLALMGAEGHDEAPGPCEEIRAGRVRSAPGRRVADARRECEAFARR